MCLFNFMRNCVSFPEWVLPFYTFISKYGRSVLASLCPWQHLIQCVSFIRTVGFRAFLHCGFHLHFSDDQWYTFAFNLVFSNYLDFLVKQAIIRRSPLAVFQVLRCSILGDLLGLTRDSPVGGWDPACSTDSSQPQGSWPVINIPRHKGNFQPKHSQLQVS